LILEVKRIFIITKRVKRRFVQRDFGTRRWTKYGYFGTGAEKTNYIYSVSNTNLFNIT